MRKRTKHFTASIMTVKNAANSIDNEARLKILGCLANNSNCANTTGHKTFLRASDLEDSGLHRKDSPGKHFQESSNYYSNILETQRSAIEVYIQRSDSIFLVEQVVIVESGF